MQTPSDGSVPFRRPGSLRLEEIGGLDQLELFCRRETSQLRRGESAAIIDAEPAIRSVGEDADVDFSQYCLLRRADTGCKIIGGRAYGVGIFALKALQCRGEVDLIDCERGCALQGSNGGGDRYEALVTDIGSEITNDKSEDQSSAGQERKQISSWRFQSRRLEIVEADDAQQQSDWQ